MAGGAVNVGKSGSIALRVVLAIILMIGFYLLAIAIAAALVWVCYAMVAYAHRIPVKLLLLCLIGAGAILWSILPRFDRFQAPGPRLLPDKHPRLFKELQQIAQATGQTMPAEVYLESDVNAWVSQRGGVMGMGGRRVMGLGLALMRVLNVSELRAVLAHEFGHYHGGDTRLGPWIYKTRSAIGRTIMTLGDSILQKPFSLYGSMFLRVTHAVSRRQEFTADRLAATVVGSAPLASGLRKVHGAGMAFNPFWQNEVAPVLSAGYLPPIADGFVRFLGAEKIARAVDGALDEEMKSQNVDPYDTHPPLPQRLAALQGLTANVQAPNEAPATSLLSDLAQLERDLLSFIASPEAVSQLTATQWEQTKAKVFLPMWRSLVKENAQLIAGLTPLSVADTLVPAIRAQGMILDEQTEARIAVAGAALALAAIDAGATLECDLGTPSAVTLNGVRIEPFSAIEALVEQKLDPADWHEQCDALGISHVLLSETGDEPTA